MEIDAIKKWSLLAFALVALVAMPLFAQQRKPPPQYAPHKSSAERSGIQAFSFGECRVLCLQDAPMRLPDRLFSDTASTGFRLTGGFHESSVNVFLVQKDQNAFLADAGHDQTRGSLHEKLQQTGIPPETISTILITHLHPDHVGGLLWNGQPLFPAATLYIAGEEYDAWKPDAYRKDLAKCLSPYENQIRLFEYGTTLPHGIIPEKRGGHPPGHTIFRMPLDTTNDELIFVGDIAHAVDLQFPHPTFCATYDDAPTEAVASRIQTLQMKGLLLGAHFPFPGIAYGAQATQSTPPLELPLEKIRQPTVNTGDTHKFFSRFMI